MNRALFPVQTPARTDWLAERLTGPRRFSVSVTYPDGRSDYYVRTGGSSMDHWSEGFDKVGLGGVGRGLALEPGDAA